MWWNHEYNMLHWLTSVRLRLMLWQMFLKCYLEISVLYLKWQVVVSSCICSALLWFCFVIDSTSLSPKSKHVNYFLWRNLNVFVCGRTQHTLITFVRILYLYRPYALTSRLHNNDAMLGVKTCRAARTCFAGRAHWRSPLSVSVRTRAQLGGVACRGLPSDCMLGDGARGVPRLTPNTTGAPFCDVICIWSIVI